ncbi:MAG: hypothetical protein AABZ02_06900 [Bacteroidota bacterium]
MDKLARALTSLIILSVTTVVRSQVLNGGLQFPLLNEIEWGMDLDQVRGALEKQGRSVKVIDTVIVLSASSFGAEATTKVWFGGHSRKLWFIETKFNEPTKAIRDSLVDYFSKLLGKPHQHTTNEQKTLFLTLNVEVVKWKTKASVLAVTIAWRGRDILNAGLLVHRAGG